jgi:hypothetical protein
MCVAPRGERIARKAFRSNSSGLARCGKPRKAASPNPSGLPLGRRRRRQRLIDTLRCRWAVARPFREARERRSGEILVQVSAAGLGRRSPREHPAVGALITCWVARDSRKGQNPGTAVRRAGPRTFGCEGIQARETVSGCFRPETDGYLSGGVSSEGRIPGALPVRNKTGAGAKGVSRREGNQTLRAERGG